MRKKRVAILGSTGSIGQNTLKVIERYPDLFEVELLCACNNINEMQRQIRRFRPRYVGLSKENLSKLNLSEKVRLFDVKSELSAVVSARNVDIVVIAMTGAAALEPFLACARAGKIIAPANKEALVMAGDVIMREAKRNGAKVIPVDSEQSAIFQCLEGPFNRAQLKRVHLTASGGALKGIPRTKHDTLSVAQILRHPRWQMGRKITVDSATLMNKGFEVIEAMRLFSLTADEVKVIIHPEAIVHSMVEFKDGSFLAQLGETDMRLPIQYALTYPQRLDTGLKPLDLTRLGTLTFKEPDTKNFPSLALAYYAAKKGGTLPCVLNAANEVAVEAFLAGSIRLTRMYSLVEKVVLKHKLTQDPTISEVRSADGWARDMAAQYLEKTK